METSLKIKTAIQENAKLTLAPKKSCSLEPSTKHMQVIYEGHGYLPIKGNPQHTDWAIHSLLHLAVYSVRKNLKEDNYQSKCSLPTLTRS